MQVVKAGLLMQLFIISKQCARRAKAAPPRLLPSKQFEAEVGKVGERTQSQVASEKEQQRSCPLEIYVIRGVSVTD